MYHYCMSHGLPCVNYVVLYHVLSHASIIILVRNRHHCYIINLQYHYHIKVLHHYHLTEWMNGIIGHDSALKVILGLRQPGLMRWILLWIMPWRRIGRSTMLASSPARYHCTTNISSYNSISALSCNGITSFSYNSITPSLCTSSISSLSYVTVLHH